MVAGTPVDVLAEGGAGDMRPRLEQELAKAESEAERARRKLGDARFVERAPAEVVAREKEKLAEMARLIEKIAGYVRALGS